MAEIAAIFHFQIEAGGLAKFLHRGRHQREHHRIADLRERFHRALHDGGGMIFGPGTFVPRLQMHEGKAGVLARAREAETGDDEDDVHVLLLVHHVVVLDLLGDVERARLCCADGQGELRQHGTLIFFRQEGGGQADEQQHQHDEDAGIDQQGRANPSEKTLQRVAITLAAIFEGLVEPGEEAAMAFVLVFRQRLQQCRAQGGRQDQRHGDRQHHRRHNGDRELAIDHARRSAKEGHRQEHSGQHQRDTDQRASDFAHGFLGRFLRAKTFFAHDALDVFDDDNGVVHQKADGEHQREHGECVDRIAEGFQHAERAQQHHRHSDGGNERGAPVLQEHEHHDDDEQGGFHQRLDHVIDRQADEGRVVHWEGELHAGREGGRQFGRFGLHGIGSGERIGAWRQLDRDTGRWMAVHAAGHGITLRPQLHARHIAQPDRRAVLVGLEHDVAELLRRFQARLRSDGGVELLAFHRRQCAKLACRNLYVLRLHGITDVVWRKAEAIQLERIEPDAHGVGRAEHLRLAHAGYAAERILQLAAYEVGDIDIRVAAAIVIERDDQEKARLRFLNDDALLLNFLRQDR